MLQRTALVDFDVKWKNLWRSILLSLGMLAVLALPTFAQAQSGQAQMYGSVRNADGPLAFVTVHVKGIGIAEYAAITDTAGRYRFEALPAGTLQVSVQLTDHKRFLQQIDLTADTALVLDIVLQADYINMEQVVISATRHEVPRNEAPVLVGVVGQRTFTASNAISVAEGLGFQPGLRVETNCQNCGFLQLRMNGLPGPYTQVLINSRPIFSALNGVYGLEQIPVNIVDRIEVVRGGGSALFGANAVAGTVNIITKEPTANFWQISHNAQWVGIKTSDQNFSANGGLVNAQQTAGIMLMGQHRVRGGFDANGDGFTEITKLNNTTFGADLFYKPWKGAKISLNGYGINEYRRGGDQLDLPPHEAEIAEELRHLTYAGGFTLEQTLPSGFNPEAHHIAVYGAAQHTARTSYYGAGRDLNAYGSTDNASFIGGAQYNYQWSRFLGGTATTIAGLEFKLDNVLDRMPGYSRIIDQKTTLYSLYVQHSYRVASRLTLLLGLRMDKHNMLQNPVLSPRANVLVNLGSKLTFRVSYGRGFRPPQAFDEDLHLALVGGEAFFVRLTPDLRAEGSHSFSSSLDFVHSEGPFQATATLSGFYTLLTDPFVLTDGGFDADSNRIMLKSNGAGAAVYGGSIEGMVAFGGKAQLEAGITLQSSQYKEPVVWSQAEPGLTTTQFLRTPNLYGYFVGSYRVMPALIVSLSGNLTGPMFAPHFAGYVAQDVLVRTPTFMEFNAKVSYDIDIGNALCITFFAGMQNIFDSYQSDFDLGPLRDANYIYGPARPRSLFVGIKLGSL